MPAGPWPQLGCGVGLRTEHYDVITREWSHALTGAAEGSSSAKQTGPSGHSQGVGWPRVDWFEAISENFMDSGGRPLAILEQIRRRYPVALHGVSLSIGSTDPLNPQYLARLKALIGRIDPAIVSDHLCWTGVEGEQLHDLLPLPFTEEAIRHVAARVQQAQEALGRRLLLENVSTYVTYRHSAMPEWEFLREVAERAGCGILLDLNNVYVNAFNHQFDPADYLAHIPGELIGQCHLAGHTNLGTHLFDTHSRPVLEEVWALYRAALRRWGPISTLIEWDADIPPFPRLAEEADAARAIYVQVCGGQPDEPADVARASR